MRKDTDLNLKKLNVSIYVYLTRAESAGQIYSVNDARYFDWPEGLRRYIDDIRQGKGQNPKQYSARYICSLVADFHRSDLLQCMNSHGNKP